MPPQRDMVESPSIVLVNTWETARQACHRILQHRLIAFDLEGVNLGREGLLTLLQIAVDEGLVFCFDVLALGKQLFSHDFLGAAFASPHIVKLCFDCRVDGDVLQAHFGLRLHMLYDMQILYTFLFQSRRDKYLKGLQHVLQTPGVILSKEALQHVVCSKGRIKKLLHANQHVFLRRPISQEVLQYCSSDVVYLLRMYKLWQTHKEHSPHAVLYATHFRLQRFCNRKQTIPPKAMSLIDF